jgi:hypothetical protein
MSGAGRVHAGGRERDDGAYLAARAVLDRLGGPFEAHMTEAVAGQPVAHAGLDLTPEGLGVGTGGGCSRMRSVAGAVWTIWNSSGPGTASSWVASGSGGG